MNGGLSQNSRILRHVDSGFGGALEGFNRACHSDALRELQFPHAADPRERQLGPAEEWQPDDDFSAIGDARALIRSLGWRRLALAAAFMATVWTATAAFAVMFGGAPVSTQPEGENHG